MYFESAILCVKGGKERQTGVLIRTKNVVISLVPSTNRPNSYNIKIHHAKNIVVMGGGPKIVGKYRFSINKIFYGFHDTLDTCVPEASLHQFLRIENKRSRVEKHTFVSLSLCMSGYISIITPCSPLEISHSELVFDESFDSILHKALVMCGHMFMPLSDMRKSSYMIAVLSNTWRFYIAVMPSLQCLAQWFDCNITMDNVIGLGKKVVYTRVNKTIEVWTHYSRVMREQIYTIFVNVKNKYYHRHSESGDCSLSFLFRNSFIRKLYVMHYKKEEVMQGYNLFMINISSFGSRHITTDPKVYSGNISWRESERFCKAYGGIPLVYKSPDEALMIRDHFNYHGWMGAPTLIFTGFSVRHQRYM